jgi:uncharacterized DUF497 family protein
LADAIAVFDAPYITNEDKREPFGEQRWQSLGILNGRVVVLIWTERGEDTRLISCRYGNKHETRTYFETFLV